MCGSDLRPVRVVSSSSYQHPIMEEVIILKLHGPTLVPQIIGSHYLKHKPWLIRGGLHEQQASVGSDWIYRQLRPNDGASLRLW